MTPRGRFVLLGLLAGAPLPGCDFFRELESDPAATTTGTDTDTEANVADESTAGATEGSCTLLNDDQCLDQDTVASCSLDDGRVREVDCVAECGGLTNFSCVVTGSGQHACWCAEPGPNKVLPCAALEDCVAGCDLSQSLECADQCFARTDAATLRLYGALVHCAEAACDQTCRQTPAQCQACIDTNRAEGGGGCSLPRGLCDTDRDPDEPWP